jgi:hypothetical protein
MNTEKESDLFNEAFTDQFLYIYKSNFNYCIVHFVSKSPFLIKTLESSENLDEIIKLMADRGKRMCVPFIKNTVYE